MMARQRDKTDFLVVTSIALVSDDCDNKHANEN